MKRLNLLMSIALVFPSAAAAQAGDDKLMIDVAKLTENALVTVRCTYGDEVGKKDLAGMGICYDAEKGEFMTLIFEPRLKAELIKDLRIVVPGVEKETIEAEFLGFHTVTQIGFVRAKKKYAWKAVKFAGRSNLHIGQKVASAGLIPGDPAGTRYFGVGYISARLRIPQPVQYITGGRLTCIGSPVFSSGGMAIGLVGQTLFMDYRMVTSRGPTTIAMKGRQETAFFIPVEQFAYALRDIPRGGRVGRLPWMGVLNITGVDKGQADLMGLDRPGAQIDNVVPGTAADKVGLKTSDVIVALDGEPLELLATPALVAQALLQRIQRKPIGQEITLTVFHSGKEDTKAKLVLSAMPPLPDEAKRYFNQGLGVVCREKVTLDQYLDKSATAKIPGLPVIGVGKPSPADNGGLQRGDLVTAVNGQPVSTVETLKQIIEDSLAKEPMRSIVLLIRRGSEEPQAISIRPPVAAPETSR